MRLSTVCSLVLGSLTLASAHGADAPQPLVLKAAHLFDGESGRLTSNAVVVVQGDKIVSVGGAAPPNARVIDLGDATLMPGLLDAHTHITSELQQDYYRGFHTEIYRFQVEQSLYAAMYAKRTLEAGFTTIRNLGAEGFIDVGLRNAIRDGVAVGPRIVAAAHSVGSTGGHCDQGPFPPDTIAPLDVQKGVCNGADQCREAVRYQMKWGADVIKICASGGVLSEADPVDVPQLTPEELRAIVSEAHAWKKKVAAHSHGDEAARLAVEAGVDSIEHGSFLSEDTLKLMKSKGTYLVPTRLAVYTVNKQAEGFPPAIAEKARAAWSAHERMMKAALKIGVPLAYGTDTGVSSHGKNGQEFALLTQLGMTPAAALMTSYQGTAKLLGVDAEVGSLKAGKVADIIAVKGNVLENIASVEQPVFVMARGKMSLGSH